MPTLRLYAAAREAAGVSSAEISGETVGEVLDEARARFGDGFSAILGSCRIWVNGESAGMLSRVGSADEVAVLPPVSGGSDEDERPRFAPSEPPNAAAKPRRPNPSDPRPRAQGQPRSPARPGQPRRPAQPGVRPGQPRRPGSGRPNARGQVPPGVRRRPALPIPPSPPPLERTELTRSPLITGDEASTGVAPMAMAHSGDDKVSVFMRMRSIGVPVTGHVNVRGKERPVVAPRPHQSALGRRYGLVYDTTGPKATLGMLWFVSGMAALTAGWWMLPLIYAITAGWAAMEASMRWRERAVAADPLVAGLGGAAIGASAALGAQAMGATICLVVLAALVHVGFTPMGREHRLSAAGNTVGCAVPFGLAAGCVMLTYDLEIGAVATLLLLVAAYDVGDFLIGSGSSNSYEGPLTGILSIGVVSVALAVLAVPPFEGTALFTFAALAAVGCPLGQLAASAILPAGDAHAPSARRLDSLLLLAPLWVFTVGLFITRI